jgi:signal transduction histidine kinase
MAVEPDRLPRTLSLAVHELRTPLAVASGYLCMLLREQAETGTDAQRAMLEGAAASCARIGALIGEMSELEQLEAGTVPVSGVPFDLAALVVELSGTMREGADREVHLEVRATSPVMVAGDRTRLATALKALMHAGLRERSEPGVILVKCSTVPDASPKWAVVTIGDEVVSRSLVDAASATPPPFDEWRGGLGLALPVARRVTEAHGGAVWSAPGSRPRTGSALRLPLVMPLEQVIVPSREAS